jgi:hypothetical protein
MNMRKLLVLLLMLVVVGLVGFALWYLFFRAAPIPTEPVPDEPGIVEPGAGLQPAEPGVVTPVEPTVPGELPTGISQTAQGGLTVVSPVSTDRTVSPSMSVSGNLSFYNANDNRFYRMNAAGDIVPLSSKEFFNVDNATFDPIGTQAIIEYPDGSNIYYDFNRDRQVTLPAHWEDFDFAPDGNRIISKSIGLDQSNRFLVISNPDGSGVRPIQELGDNADKVTVDWSPNNQVVAMSETGETFDVGSQEVYMIGQNFENFKSMVVEGLDFRPSWTPNGEQLLYSVAGEQNDWKPSLWVVDAAGDDIGRNRRNLNIETWADKCTFADNSTLYCAVPDYLERGYGLQPGLADNIPDTIYRIDVNTGLRTQIAIPEGGQTVDSLMLTPDRSALYFTEQGTGFLNKIELAP